MHYSAEFVIDSRSFVRISESGIVTKNEQMTECHTKEYRELIIFWWCSLRHDFNGKYLCDVALFV